MCTQFPYGPLRIKKALGICQNGNNNPSNRHSDLGPFPGPKTHTRKDRHTDTDRHPQLWHQFVLSVTHNSMYSLYLQLLFRSDDATVCFPLRHPVWLEQPVANSCPHCYQQVAHYDYQNNLNYIYS